MLIRFVFKFSFIYNVLLICIVLFFFENLISCTKSKDRKLTSYTKYALNVDTGSIFVYRDSMSSDLDTYKVYSNSGLITTYYNTDQGYADPYFIESIDYGMARINVKSDSTKWDIKLRGYAPSRVYAYIYYYDSISNLMYSDSRARLYAEPFIFDTASNSGQYSWSESQRNEAQYPSFTLQNKQYLTVFQNVHLYQSMIKMGTSNIDSVIFYQTKTLFSLDSGLIKFTLKNEKEYIVKELIYSNIKRKYQ